MSNHHTTEAAAVADIAAQNVRIETVEGLPVEVTKEGVSFIEKHLPAPINGHTRVSCSNLTALKTYLEDQKATNTRIFFDREQCLFHAVLDYAGDFAESSWRRHTADCIFETDSKFKKWEAAFAKENGLSQTQLIDLFEEGESDFITPSSADMLTLAQDLEIYRNDKVISRRNATNGTGILKYECVEGEGSTKIPERIVIGVPLFSGDLTPDGTRKAYQIEIRIRYRVNNGQVTFWLSPKNLDDVRDMALDGLSAEVSKWGYTLIEGTVI